MTAATASTAVVLDTYFKSYFWSFKLGMLAVAAFITAQTANAFVRRSLAIPASDIAAPRPSRAASGSPSEQDLSSAWSALLERNVFKSKREDLTPVEVEPEVVEVVEAPKNPEDYTEENCVASSLPLALVSTSVNSTDPEQSSASFQDSSQKDLVIHRVGDRILDKADLVWIERRNAFIMHNNRCERFSLNPKDQQPSIPRGRPQAKQEEEPDLGDGIAKVNENEYTIPRAEIDSVLSNLNKIATQARIVPSFRNGKANGFKLFSIRPGSLYAKIGIKNGDIIQKINGYEINSPDRALAVYSKLKDANNISVDLLRRGKKKSLSYNIR